LWPLLYGDEWKFGVIELWIKSHPRQNKIKCHDLVQMKIMLKINKLNVYNFSVVNIKYEGGKLKDFKRLCLQNLKFLKRSKEYA
jgi:hypothetical protein